MTNGLLCVPRVSVVRILGRARRPGASALSRSGGRSRSRRRARRTAPRRGRSWRRPTARARPSPSRSGGSARRSHPRSSAGAARRSGRIAGNGIRTRAFQAPHLNGDLQFHDTGPEIIRCRPAWEADPVSVLAFAPGTRECRTGTFRC